MLEVESSVESFGLYAQVLDAGGGGHTSCGARRLFSNMASGRHLEIYLVHTYQCTRIPIFLYFFVEALFLSRRDPSVRVLAWL